MQPLEGGTAGRYDRAPAVPMPIKVPHVCHILAPISSYELPFGCSSALWTRMDEGYNTMVLDLHFDLMEKLTFFPPFKWLSLVHAPPYYVLFAPLAIIYS
jgi:hypothetical protein